MKVALGALLGCAALVPIVQARVDTSLGTWRTQEEILYVWSGEDVRRLLPGLEGLMADIYWLRTVQYFGGQRVFGVEKRFEVLEPLIDITVTLDPRFEIAYRYGATFLSEPWPIGAGRPEKGVALLERGARALPRSWLLVQNLAFFIYFHLGEPERAARVLLEGAKLPGAPHWFETMAADFLARGGERETARRMWQRMYEQAEDGQLKRNALVHLEYLDAEEAIERIEQIVGHYRSRTGANPDSLRELVGLGILTRLPTDPAGVPFDYDRTTGRVTLSRQSRLWRAPVLPRRREST